jgi:hypothetical protein
MFYQAEGFNRDIGGWAVHSVTDMIRMFSDASAFNQDIGDWAVHSVTSMYGMFNGASAFDQDLSAWRIDKITSMRMRYMFYYASVFDQNLGWCVDNDVDLGLAFYETECASTLCGVVQVADVADCPTPAPTYVPTTGAPTPARTPRPSEALPCTDKFDMRGPCYSGGSGGGGGGVDAGPIIGGAVGGAVLLLAVGALWFYCRRKGSETEPSGVDSPLPPKLAPLKARPEEEAISVAPEAEQLPPPPAKGWFAAPEPEGEPESFAPQLEPEFEPEA